MLEYFLKLSDFTEQILAFTFIIGFFSVNQNFFVSSFFGHTGSGIEYYYLIEDNFLYIFLFLFFAVVIDIIFFFLGKLGAKIFGKKLSGSYPKTLENYFLLYFRFVPFLGYFGNTIVGMNTQIKLKTLMLKNLLGSTLRFGILGICYFLATSIHQFYFDEITVLLHQAGRDIDLTLLVLHILFYSSFIIIVSIFYAIKYKNLKKQRKYG